MMEPTEEGVPQGGPLSPLLANLLLDDLDRELEKRGHRFVRYADDVNIYVRSQRAGERVLASVKSFLERRLKLQVNLEKSAVGRPWHRVLLGFTFVGREFRRRVSDKALSAIRSEQDLARLAVVLWLRRGAEPTSRGREVDSSAPAVLSLEAVG
jgi:RNA-directed DNA polymerase